MRSGSRARATRPLRAGPARLSHEQEALEHGRTRLRTARSRVAQDDRSFLRSGGAESAENCASEAEAMIVVSGRCLLDCGRSVDYFAQFDIANFQVQSLFRYAKKMVGAVGEGHLQFA